MPDLKLAAQLIEDGAITKVEDPHVYTVESRSNPGTLHVVTLGEGIAPRCTCPAHGPCVHLVACITFDREAVAQHYARMASQAKRAKGLIDA